MPAQILIVDDHEVLRKSLHSLLSSRPTEWNICGEAADGIEAVEKAKALRPDVVIMDISMPRMDGMEATRIIRRELPSSKVVIVSQNDPAIAQRQAREADAAAYVGKGDLARNLLPTLERLLSDPQVGATPGARSQTNPASDWLAGGGELGQLIRNHDWAQTSLGPIQTWPQSLKTVVRVMLTSRFAMWMSWGPDLTFLYNDAYAKMTLGKKHPWALGKQSRLVWEEIWDDIGPRIQKVLDTGEATWDEALLLFLERSGYREETYHTFSYSPLSGDDGKIAGHLCVVTEETDRVIGERRLKTLRSLATELSTTITEEDVVSSLSRSLAENEQDLPFTLTYLLSQNGMQARLASHTGIPAGHSAAPEVIDLAETNQTWPMSDLLRGKDSVIVEGLTKRFDGLPTGAWDSPPNRALLLPMTSQAQGTPAGIIVIGLNPYRPLDVSYTGFLNLIAGQIAASIANARAYEDEKSRAEALAEIDRAKTLFFSNVSHEFRTPLTLMLGPVEELLSRSHTDLSPAAKSQLELVNRNGSRLLRLVNTLLDFSRIEAGRMQAIYLPTDLAAFTVELASVFRSATERAGLRLEIDCPKLAELVLVDRGMWEKIVLNLISNAFKFTFEGSITVALKQTANQAELRVRDTGVGIPAAELPRLFDRFHRIENTRSRTHEGSGIGLALVQELVKLHGGSVRVESVYGEGSTFIVGVPLGSAHLPADRIGGTRTLASTALGAGPFVEEALRWLPDSEYHDAADEDLLSDELIPVPCPPITGAGAGASSEKRPLILVADDNADMRQYLVRLLSERYEVRAVADGQAALEALRDGRPALVLTDVMMPHLDGFGLLHELRSNPETKAIPIILLSARAGEESRVEGMEKGADDYVIKPFSARELLARVQTHIEMSRVREKAEEDMRRRTEQFETLLNEAPLGVYLVDGDLRIREMNPTAERVFGNIRNLIGRDFDEVIHLLWSDTYADDVVKRFRHTLESGEPYLVPEQTEQRRDRGVHEIYEWQINRIPLPDGSYGVVCYFRDISRQVEAREAIARSEQQLRLATEAAELGIWNWYPREDRATWENDRCYHIMGRTVEEGPFGEAEFTEKVIHPDDKESFQARMATTLETGARFFFQGRIRLKDGTWGWVELTAQVEYRPDGSLLRLLGTVLDITRRKQAEEVLRQHRERFDLVAEAAQVGFWFCDLPFDKLTWDNRVKEHFWLPPDANVTMDTFYERIHPDDRERTRRAIADSNANDTRYDIEYRTISPDGREKWIRAMGRTFYDASHQPKSFDGLTLDITERKRIEDRERQMTAEAIAATAKFRAVFEQTPVFAGIMTVDGVVMDANQLCLEACGYKAEEVLGRHFWDTGWWRKSTEVQAKIRAATEQAAQGRPYQEVLPYHWADGTERIVDFALHPILDHQGQILFLHPTGVDITDLKRAEENYRLLAQTLDAEVRARTSELEQRNVEVVRQSELLRDLSSRLLRAQDEERRRIARELHDSAGQLLTVLGINMARVAQQATQHSPQLAKDASDSQQLVQQLSQEIRTMSYLLHPPLLEEVGLSEALRWYAQGLTDRSGLEIKLNIPDDFGRLPREMELVMFRLVQECLTNIHRHSGSKVAIIEIARKSASVSLEVQDEGKGISPQRLTALQSQASGVGLRGMRERVRQFEGEMNIESSEKGTRIAFTIPLGEATDLTRVGLDEQLQNAG